MTCATCGSQLRRRSLGKPNTNTLCAKHKVYSTAEYQRARYAKGYRPPQRPDVFHPGPGMELAAVELEDSRILGHIVGHMDEDSEPDTWIGRCATCKGYLAVDLNECDERGAPSHAYGKVYRKHCPGKPLGIPADRRDPFVEEAFCQLTEGPDYKDLGPIRPNWDDPQGYNLGKNRTKGNPA